MNGTQEFMASVCLSHSFMFKHGCRVLVENAGLCKGSCSKKVLAHCLKPRMSSSRLARVCFCGIWRLIKSQVGWVFGVYLIRKERRDKGLKI